MPSSENHPTSAGDSRLQRLLSRRRTSELTVHERSGEIPEMEGETYDAFKLDIAIRGVELPLEITPDNRVLDGRARLRAAVELEIAELDVAIVTPPDELEHVVRRELLRTHLDPSQRGALATFLLPVSEIRDGADRRRLQNLTQNQHENDPERAPAPAREGRTRDQLAAIAGVGERTAQDILTVWEHDPARFDAVLRGRVSAKTAASQVRRRQRDQAIPPAPPLPEGPFGLIYADPPWEMGSPDSPTSPEQHYPTMPLQAIKQLAVPAADDCVLFLWAVTMLLPQALEVIDVWGFRYRSCAVWVKNGIGPGVWFRQRHELLLVATRGHVAPPDGPDRCDSVIEAPRGRHSAKPDAVYQLIEQMYPDRSKLELFGRGTPRRGWTSWGNEVTE